MSFAEGEWPNELTWSYQLLIFDWDGTAVLNRKADASHLIRAMENLLKKGVLLTIVTGTRLDHIQKQCLQYISSEFRHRVLVCTNRGSEVYGFSPDGASRLLYQRLATPEENDRLDRAAIKVQSSLQGELNLKTHLIFDRMNRRKIDLIPLPEWNDPPKSRIDELLRAVTARIQSNPQKIELPKILRLSRQIAEKCGLQNVKVTSDVKHVEIGLTDKSDSVRWVLENVIYPRGIPSSEILILGDEFGSIGGIPGSDSFLLIPGFQKVQTVSVGIEPNSVPNNVIHIPGGPKRFVTILETLANIPFKPSYIQTRFTPTPDPSWCVEQNGFNPSEEREMETIFTIGNGYLGVRGALDLLIPASQADLFLAGIYDEKTKKRPYSELEFMTPRRVQNPYVELVSFPFPFQVNAIVNGRSIRITETNTTSFLRTLDLRKAMLFISQELSIGQNQKVYIESFRCACMHDPHLLLQEVSLDCQPQYSDAYLEMDLNLVDLEIQHPHLKLISQKYIETNLKVLLFETYQSKFQICLATRTWRTSVRHKLSEPAQTLRQRRMTCIYTSRDISENEDIEEKTIGHLQALDPNEFDEYTTLHQEYWKNLWERADITFGSDQSATEAQRFNAYHLLIAAPKNSKSSVPARSLSGRGYEGHVFWDTEIFIIPFFLYQFPDIAKTLLVYRYQTLNGARAQAKEMGYKGACYAWESTVDGSDVTPTEIVLKSARKKVPIFTGNQQIHVTADVAFAIWKYWEATHDQEFLTNFGTEILIETARFWASRVQRRGQLFHIEKVVGPDEYHHSVDDNAYTNWLAKFNLDKSILAVKWLRKICPEHYQRLKKALGFEFSEIQSWTEISNQLFLPQPNKEGIIEQFHGFFDLEKVPIDREERLKAPLNRLYEWKKINRMQLIKQADVLMLFFLFPKLFPQHVLEANYRFYEPMTDHGSSLSPAVHGTIAAWLGQTENAQKYYSQSVELDLFNLMENTSLGIHAACIAGAWYCLIFGILGIYFTADGPKIAIDLERNLPESWLPIELSLSFRGKDYQIRIDAQKARVA